ncbi:hypothetical protein ACFU8Q_11935 [Streptomyces sp. NPDC057543]|uniref:hypothetical protein n=1 Tax=Streptomyces sp. NPDC057543 TaxID=3346163 RepID=UPI0036910B03
MENRREAIRGVAGCVVAAAGGAAGMLAWAPYARRGIFGFEGESEWDVVWFGLPVMTLGGIAAGITLFTLVQGKWRQALGAGVLLTALIGFGVVFDVLAGPPPNCDPC